jgi:hypothetical protein
MYILAVAKRTERQNSAMRVFVVVWILLEAHSRPGFGLERCPAGAREIEAIVQALEIAPNCKESLRIMDMCLFGASGDVPLAAAVIRKCEAAFLTKLSHPELAAYKRERGACIAKYAKMEGSMYISAAATCEATVASQYAQRVGRQR